MERVEQEEKQREKQDKKDIKRLNRIMPYKPENIKGTKHCQMTNCQSLLKYRRYAIDSKTCNICTENIKYSAYSCVSGAHEWHACKSCYAQL